MTWWHSHSEMGLRTLSPAHQQGTLPGTQNSLFSLLHSPLPQPYNNFLCIDIFASRPVVSRFWFFLSDSWTTNPWEKDHSLPTSTRHQRCPLCKEAKCERWYLVHMSLEPLSSLQCIALHKFAPWLVQKFCVEGPMPHFSQPLRLSVQLWRNTLSSWRGTRGLVQRCPKWWYSDMNWLVP